MRIFLVILFAALCISCSEKPDTIESDIAPYRGWKKVLKKVIEYPVPGHGAGARVIYANDAAFKTKILESREHQKKIILPEGALIIKESYKSIKEINSSAPVIYIMKKNSKSPDSIEGWMYYVRKPGMKIMFIKGRMCVGCHEAANERHPYFDGNEEGIFRDYIFTPILK